MRKINWDTYFHSHYNPVGKNWGRKDLKKYKSWYYSWIAYICGLSSVRDVLRKDVTGFEIGSGIGGTTSLLAEKGIQMTGSDISKEIVREAKRTNKNIPFIFCDIQKGIPTKKKYNFIFAFEVLEHLANPIASLKHIRSALKPNGIFVASTPYPFGKAYSDPTHCSVHFPKEWKKMLKSAGFSRVETRPMSFLPFLWRWSKYLNIVIPFYIPFNDIVSTTLIIAEK